MWPRYFIASEEAQVVPDVSQAPLRYAVDLFRAPLSVEPPPKKDKPAGKSGEGAKVAPVSEWVVAADSLGNLNLLPAVRNQLPADLKRQVNTNELLAPPRSLNVSELFLFDIEHAEAQGNPAGLNDPVVLNGRIFGPYPSERPMCARGQLTVTRADVLDGIVRGLPCAFHYAETHRPHGEHRCLHLMLPGTTAQELKKGKGALLAFPMLSDALNAGDPSNQSLVAGFLYDLLVRLQADFLQENIRGAFPDLKLPVPSRRRHEAGLKARGYEIHGDTVYAPIAKPSKTWIGKLFQNIGREKAKLPPEGTLNDFIRLAQLAARSIPGWPDARGQVVQTLTRLQSCTWKPGEDALLKPVPVTDHQPHVATFEMTDIGILSPRKPSNKGERHICFIVDPSFAFRRHADLEIRIEYQGGPGVLAIDHVQDLPEPKGRHSLQARMDDSIEVKTASFSLSNALIERAQWNTDFALYIKSKKDFTLRSITLIGSGELAVEAPVKLDHVDTGLKVESGGKGWLDCAGRWTHWYMGPMLLFPRKPGFEISFNGWILDTQRKSAEGSASLVLKSKTGEISFSGTRRERQDVVCNHNNIEAYAQSGVDVKVPSDSVPAGEYKAFLRLMRPDGRTCVEVDTTRTIRFYDEPLENASRDSGLMIEATSSYWSWGIDVHGYDPGFRNGACSGSGEISHRVWLKKDRAYQIAFGVMEPDHTERGKRVFELVVGGRTFGKYDLVEFPGTKQPRVLIVPVCMPDSDGWVEVKVSRHKDSKGDHNVVLYGLWVFAEGETFSEEAIARGSLTEKALLYWAPGQALQHCLHNVLNEAMPHLAIKAGRSGLQIKWRDKVVAEENPGNNQASIAAAFFVDQQHQPLSYGLSLTSQPEAAIDLVKRLTAAAPYTLLALAISGELDRGYAEKLKNALKGWGIQVVLPGESGSGRKNLIAVGVKGMATNYGIEFDGTDDLQFPVPPPANPGLVGHWKLDEGVSKVLDSSGRGHHGSIAGGKWIKTPAGHVLELNGTGYVSVPYHDDFNIPGDMSMAFWMCSNEIPERDILMAGRGDPLRPYLFWYSRHHVVFQQCNRYGVGMSWLGTQPQPLRKWIHIAAVVSGQMVTLYNNGVQCDRRNRHGLPGQTQAPFTIGGFANTWHPMFKGAIADVRLYNRAINHDELLQVIKEMPPERLIVDKPKKRKPPKKSE